MLLHAYLLGHVTEISLEENTSTYLSKQVSNVLASNLHCGWCEPLCTVAINLNNNSLSLVGTSPRSSKVRIEICWLHGRGKDIELSIPHSLLSISSISLMLPEGRVGGTRCFVLCILLWRNVLSHYQYFIAFRLLGYYAA